MKSWELSKNIIAFFQSFPRIETRECSFFSTVVSQNYQLYQTYHSNFDNPEIKSDPFEILEEIIQLLQLLPQSKISIDLLTNIDYIHEPRHQLIFEMYIAPMIQGLSAHTKIYEYREMDIDLFSLKGLYHNQKRNIISDTVNTIIYV